MTLPIREPLELSAGPFGLDACGVEKCHVALAIDDDNRPVVAANELDHVGHQSKGRFADTRAPEDVKVLECKFEMNQHWIVVEECPGNDDRILFLDVSAIAKAFAVAIKPIPSGVL